MNKLLSLSIYLSAVLCTLLHLFFGDSLWVEKTGVIQKVQQNCIVVDYQTDYVIEKISENTSYQYVEGDFYFKTIVNPSLRKEQVFIIIICYFISIVGTIYLLFFKKSFDPI